MKSTDFGLKLDPSLRCSVPADANANGVILILFLLRSIQVQAPLGKLFFLIDKGGETIIIYNLYQLLLLMWGKKFPTMEILI